MERYFVGIYKNGKMLSYMQEKTELDAKKKVDELKQELKDYDVYLDIEKNTHNQIEYKEVR